MCPIRNDCRKLALARSTERNGTEPTYFGDFNIQRENKKAKYCIWPSACEWHRYGLTFAQLDRFQRFRRGRIGEILEVDDEQRDVVHLRADRGYHLGTQEFRAWKKGRTQVVM